MRLDKWPISICISELLKDHNTGSNIKICNSDYPIAESTELTLDLLQKLDIKRRIDKSKETQLNRQKVKAEVFTPILVVRKMNDYLFKHIDDLINAKILEITMGEGAFLCSRYDHFTGDPIDIENRVGIIDRKLQCATSIEQFYKCYESTFGYELQGDSLLLARVNMLFAFCEYVKHKLKRKPTNIELIKVSKIIACNLWQMDGITKEIPFEKSKSLFHKTVKPKNLKIRFEYAVGNPPYQRLEGGNNLSYMPSIYHLFMDSAYSMADRVLLITPARFLFNMKTTPVEFNQRMLNDPYFKVICYSRNTVFNLDIRGGIAVTYRDITKKHKPIGLYISNPNLRSIYEKVRRHAISDSFTNLIYTQSRYTPKIKKYNKLVYDLRIKSSAFTESWFHELKIKSTDIKIFGLLNLKRQFRYIDESLFDQSSNGFNYWKVALARTNGRDGTLGERLTMPEVLPPKVGFTNTYFGYGKFKAKKEAENCAKFLRTKFCRCLLGVLKCSPNIAKDSFLYVPNQDFSSNSDIDWNADIPSIDNQLCKKYGLSKADIEFIHSLEDM